MSRLRNPAASVLAAGLLLLAACGAATAGAGQPASGCSEARFEVSVTPHGRVGDTGFLTIGLSNCGEQELVLDSHPDVGVFGGDVTVRREGNQAESIVVAPQETLVAPLTWVLVTEPATGTITVDRLLVNASPDPAGSVIDVEPSFELHIDHILDVGAWQRASGLRGPEPSPTDRPGPVETETPESGDGECPEPGFRITVSGGNAAMGVRAAGIEMINCGDVAIEVDGYPMIEVLHHGEPVAVEVRRGSDLLDDLGPSRIVVEPGESVRAGLAWRNRVESVNADDIVTATALVMSYAEGAPTLVVEPEYPVDLGTTRQVEVTAWR